MVVHRSLGMRLGATLLADTVAGKPGSGPVVHRKATPEVWQTEGDLTITAVGSPEDREKGRVRRDRQQLPFTKRPAPRRKVAREHHDLTDKWIHLA